LRAEDLTFGILVTPSRIVPLWVTRQWHETSRIWRAIVCGSLVSTSNASPLPADLALLAVSAALSVGGAWERYWSRWR
jgi:hypothetical protein